MNDVAPSLEKKEKNWLVRILKITFILAAFVLVGITVLANMGGSNDSLKDSVEKFVGGFFQGRPTKVDKLVYMSFFPKMGFDAQGIKVLSNVEDGYEIVKIGKAQIFMGFWNVALRRPRVASFYLEDFRAIKGAMGPKEFYIEKIFIDHDIENNSAKLRGNGKIGDNPWLFNIDINVKGSKGNYSYIFLDKFDFTFDVADIHSKGIFINHEDGYFKFQDLNITYGDVVFSGDLVLSALGKKMMKLKGRVKSSADQNILSPDLVFDYTRSPIKIEGDIASSSVDISSMNSILPLFVRLREIVGYNDKIEADKKYDWSALFDSSTVKFIANQEQEL